LPRTHAAGVHRDDLLVEAGKAALVFADQLRIEAALPVARNGKLERSGVGQNRLLAVAVARIAALVTLQMMIQLRLQRSIGQRLLQLVDQAVRIEGRLGVGPDQQLVENRVGDNRLSASGHWGSPFFPLCPPAHEIPDSPATPTTTRSPRRSKASTKLRSSIDAGRGPAWRPSSSPPSNRSNGTIDASSSGS